VTRFSNPFTRYVTDRLVLRRPVEADLDVVHEIHADPTTNRYNPAGPDRDLSTSRRWLQRWLEHWARNGFGYWTVESRADGEVLGFTGIRYDSWLGQPVLNLYYRFSPAVWGRGIATEGARCAVSLAGEHLPGLPVLARTTQENIPSQRTAMAAGLTRRPDLDRDDGAAYAAILVTFWPTDAPHG